MATRTRTRSARRRGDAIAWPGVTADGRSLDQAVLQAVVSYLSGTTVVVKKVRLNTADSNASVGIGWNEFDGFYWESTGVVIYASNGTPSVLFANGVTLAFESEFRWAPDGNLPGAHAGNLTDLGLGRADVGVLKVSGGDESARGTLQIGEPYARPAAAAGRVGTFWLTPGGAGNADVLEVCLKNADDSYGWAAVAAGTP